MRKINLVGLKLGQLTVVEATDKRTNDGCIIYRCECDCGNKEYYCSTSELRRTGIRAKKFCNKSIHNIKDLTGQTFGYLTVLNID